MIQANELRLGNLVMIENELLPETKGKYYKINGINKRFDMYFPDSNYTVGLDCIKSIRTYSQFSEFIKPIPLTPELLVKCGFVFNECEEYWECAYNPDFIIRRGDKKGTYATHYEVGITTLIFSYLHELQNIYFVLYSEELNVEL